MKLGMEKILRIKDSTTWAVILLFFTLNLLFPNTNLSVDDYAYAIDIRRGNPLFLPHHLLYNFSGYYWSLFIRGLFPEISILAAMQGLNTTAAVLILIISRTIFLRLGLSAIATAAALLFVGSSYGFWRFALGNETYILPILCSITASYYFLLYVRSSSTTKIILAGFFSALACLFHQIHVAWWLGLLFGVYANGKSPKPVILFMIPAIIIPIAYIGAFSLESGSTLTLFSLTKFILLDFYQGNVDTPGWITLILTAINLIRTFYQVHGNMLYISGYNPFLAGCAVLALLAGLIGCTWWALRRSTTPKTVSKDRTFQRTHLVIFTLHLTIALLSNGNAEFMAVLPLLAMLITSPWIQKISSPLFFLAASMFIWNFCWGVYPNHAYRLTPERELLNFIQEHPQDLFIAYDYPLIENMYTYAYLSPPDNLARAPEGYRYKNLPVSELHKRIQDALDNHHKVFTDCLRRPGTLDRANFIRQGDENDFFTDYTCNLKDAILCTGKTYYLYELSKK